MSSLNTYGCVPLHQLHSQFGRGELQLCQYTNMINTMYRNEELAHLQLKHIESDCKGPAPYNEDHFKIHLQNRKGWQRKLDNDDLNLHSESPNYS